MPDSDRSKRWWFTLGAVSVLSLVVIVLSVVGLLQRRQLNEVRTTLTAVNTSLRTAEVATCYATARSRPKLITILRTLTQADAPTSRAAKYFIDQWEVTTPTIKQCDQTARKNGFAPSDFPEITKREPTVR